MPVEKIIAELSEIAETVDELQPSFERAFGDPDNDSARPTLGSLSR